MDERTTRVGDVLGGRYRVLERLGAGATGVVYLGEQVQLGRQVAIKFLSELHLDNERSQKRFEREAMAMSKLSHPNCISVFDFGIEGSPYIVMDFAEGKSLDVMLSKERFEPPRALRLVLQVLSGLAHAHGQGIVHRDVKPGNIVVSQVEGAGEQARLLDFSLAKLMDDSDGGLTGAFDVMGTPFYMSPEQTMGELLDERTDLYAAGVILFELLAGERPFDGDSVRAIFRRHREDPPPRLGAVARHAVFSEELEAVVARSLAKKADDRYESAEAFMAALRYVPEARDITDITLEIPAAIGRVEGAATVQMTHEEIEQSVNGVPAKQSPSPKKKPLILIVAAAGLLVAVITSVIVLLAPGSVDEDPETAGAQERTDGGPGGAPTVDDHVATALSRAKEMVSQGDDKQAISLLQSTRVISPEDARLPYALGNIFARKSWWADALKRYENAVSLDPSLKGDPVMNRNLIAALAAEKLHQKVGRFITSELGREAVPFLKAAVVEAENPRVRRRATKLLETIGAGS